MGTQVPKKGMIFMSKNRNVVFAKAAQNESTDLASTVASCVAQGLYRQPRNKSYVEGFDTAVRNCAEALLRDGNDREYIACLFDEMPFPSTDNTIWDVSWDFDDWDAWVAAEESESEV